MRVLAIDHGKARAGCAISDPTGTIARPLGVIESPDPQKVAELVAEHDADLVVVGLPVSLGGAEGALADRVRGMMGGASGDGAGEDPRVEAVRAVRADAPPPTPPEPPPRALAARQPPPPPSRPQRDVRRRRLIAAAVVVVLV